MENKSLNLVLASASPRRKELLGYTYLPFTIIKSDVEEITDLTNPSEVVVELARQKCVDVLNHKLEPVSNSLVIGADTIVVRDDAILGKPKNIAEARSMLESLSGRSHEVYTGVHLATTYKQMSFYEKTLVEFSEIDCVLLEKYLATGESMDKAGSYGIQSYSLGFIKSVKGSYSNVVGLPVCSLIANMKKFLGKENIYEEFT